MYTLVHLVKRNMYVYLRNKTNVMLSFLSMVIILGLNTIFLGDINKSYLSEVIKTSDTNIDYFINSWLMAGVIVVNAFMVALAVLNIMVEDEEKHKMTSFIIAPISKITLTMSYIIAACITSFVFSSITLILSEIYIYITCNQIITFLDNMKMIGIMLINIFSIVSIVICMAAVTKSTNAYSTLNMICGTLVGFITAIYLPIGSLPKTVQSVLRCFPILHGTAAMREIYTKGAIDTIFKNAPYEIIEDYKAYMGIQVTIGGYEGSIPMSLLILIISGIIFSIFASFILARKQASDR